jgi:predicted RNA methylase
MLGKDRRNPAVPAARLRKITFREERLTVLDARSAVLYQNNPFGTVCSRRAERHFLSRWLSSSECAAKFSSPEL